MSTVAIGPFVRFAIMAAAAVYENWDTISGQFDRAVTDAAGPDYGRYCQHVFEMNDGTGTFSVRERGMYGVHYINITGGDLDRTWTTADFTAVETAQANMWTALSSRISTGCRLVEHRWYKFGPGIHGTRSNPNPPVRVTTLATPIAGSGSGAWAHQVGSTVTFRTPIRRHWGRVYLPIYTGVLGTNGQVSSTSVDAIAAAARTAFMVDPAAQGIAPVVWDRNRHSALGVTALEVDSVPDIVRRRRPRVAAYKVVSTS
jgi:hypothetical protein